MRDELKALIENEGPGIIDRILDELVCNQNKMMWNAFEKYGYTREWLVDNYRRVKVEVCYIGVNSERCYYVDGVLLFGIFTEIETRGYITYTGVNYYKALPEEKENEKL